MFWGRTKATRPYPVIIVMTCKACAHKWQLTGWENPDVVFCSACRKHSWELLTEAERERRVKYFQENPPSC